jgi:uncharacterized protein YkvS
MVETTKTALSKVQALFYRSTIERLTPVQEQELKASIAQIGSGIEIDNPLLGRIDYVAENAQMLFSSLTAVPARKTIGIHQLLEDCQSLSRSLASSK